MKAEKKKKKPTKKQVEKQIESELVDTISDMLIIMGNSHSFSKSMINGFMSTITGVLHDNPAFRRMLADPKADLTHFEPIIKRLMKRKKHA